LIDDFPKAKYRDDYIADAYTFIMGIDHRFTKLYAAIG
jgi:hypothetical protein